MQAGAVALAVVLFAPLFAAEAQQATRVWRIGWLDYTSLGGNLNTFKQALRDLGWVEGKTFVLDYRGGEGKVDRLPGLAAELVRLPVDVILAPGTPEALAAKKATNTIPIVMLEVADPVESRLVNSLARPGGNVTGLTNIRAELSGKLLTLLKEAVPLASRIAVLWDQTEPDHRVALRSVEAAAQSSRLAVLSHGVRHHSEVEPAFSAMKAQRADAVIVIPSARLVSQWTTDLALKHQLPLASTDLDYAWRDGLMAYVHDREALFTRAAAFVDKILRGAKPADLPVEQPTKFELAINLKTAKTLGLAIPPSLLLRADRVFE